MPIVWIAIVTGAITALAGLAFLLAPRTLLGIAFAAPNADDATLFFARHWGLLIALVGALTVWSAYEPALRTPVLAAAAVEKIALVALVFFGPIKRTLAMTVIALTDGLFAALYIAYLVVR